VLVRLLGPRERAGEADAGGSVAGVEEHAHRPAAVVGNDEVGRAIPVQAADRHEEGVKPVVG